MTENPCKDCEKKGCCSYHDICEKHKEYKEELAKRKKKFTPFGRGYIKPSTFNSRVHKKG